MSRLIIKSTMLAAGLLAVTTYATSAQAEMASAETLAAPCAGCHGTNGSSHGPATPSIAGITTEYFLESMKAYVSGDRKSTVMGRIAKGYSEEEMKVMADYFTKQKIVRYEQNANAELAAKGAPLFQKYCEGCHEQDGYLADGIGVMAGQSMSYLRFMVQDFFSGEREWTKKQKKKMQALMNDHGWDGYEAVINYQGSKK